MFEAFIKTLKDKCGVAYGDSILACCSGGIDSMALLRLIIRASYEMNLSLHAVTIDHGLRCEAPGDAEFVLETCGSLGVDASLYNLKMNPETPNLEEEARIRRYEAICDCKKRLGYKFYATGHTANDQAETLIYRLVRGTGVRGLACMDYARPDGLIRPMLDINRSEVEAFAREHSIKYVTDQSNNNPALVRNLIRIGILPLMRDINPLAEKSISRFAAIASLENSYLIAQTEMLEKRALLHDWTVLRVYDARILEQTHEALLCRFIIYLVSDMLEDPRGISSADVRSALDVLMGRRSAHLIRRKVRIEKSSEFISFERIDPYLKQRCHIALEGPGIHILDSIGKQIWISGVPDCSQVTARLYLAGDRIGVIKVSEIMQDKKVPVPLRKCWPVILFGKSIVSVAGLFDTEGIKTEFPYREP